MSSWIWMKGLKVAIADAIAPVNDKDVRQSVKDLIAEHRVEIDQIKVVLENDPLYERDKHDDLWIVRFLLSHKNNHKAAIKAAKYTLAFRKEHKLDEQDLRPFPPNKNAKSEALSQRFLQYCKDDGLLYVVPDVQLGVIGFIRLVSVDSHGIVANVSEKDWLPSFLYLAEWTHQWLDFTTRTTGRLTKSVRFIDFQGMNLALISKEMAKRAGNFAGVMEECYPQAAQTIFLCNTPVWIQKPWRLFRPLLPKRVLAKIDIICPEKNVKERLRLFAYIDEEKLPVRFGGTNPVWPIAFPLPPTTPG